MKKIFVIGIGAGNPDYITVQAINALNEVDVFFLFDKGRDADDLVRIRKEICERFIKDHRYRFVEIKNPERVIPDGGYKAGVEDWHRQRAEAVGAAITSEIAEGEKGAFLVWGDPSLYDSTLRILELVLAQGALEFEYEVIPGISSVQALAARHRIALNAIGESIQITSGRKLVEGMPNNMDSIVVMLDVASALQALRHEDIDIHWGAYLGTPDEILVSGKLRELIDDIERIRVRERGVHGWIMETCLLRRSISS